MMALIAAGAQSGKIYFDVTGRSAEFAKLLEILAQGDRLIVHTADDVAFSPSELAALIGRFEHNGVTFVALEESWLSCAHQHSQNNTQSKTQTNTNGEVKKVGRPMGPQRDMIPKLDFALNLYHTAHHLSIREICDMAKVNERTFYRHLERTGYQVVRRHKGRKPTNKHGVYLP